MKTEYFDTFTANDKSMTVIDVIDECNRIQIPFVRDEATGIRWELWFPQQTKEYK